jgi:SAM-dependent methyltransferase
MTDIVADVWNKAAHERNSTAMRGWLDSPLIQHSYVDRLIGADGKPWLDTIVDRLAIPRTGRWLSIGCGNGHHELYAAKHNLCREIVGIDIAPEAIAIARAQATELGIPQAHFDVLDLEHERLPRDQYDVVLCAAGLHHIRRLEFVYEEFANSLKPDGWLILNEFVGASQWQWPDAQLKAINTLFAALPERYRRNTRTGQIEEHILRPTIEEMNAADPSESIRSAELMPLLRQQFELAEVRGYGGCILHKLLEDKIANYAEQHAADTELLALLCAAEQALIQAGALQDDFVLAAARNRKHMRRPSRLPLNHDLDRCVVAGCYPIEYDARRQPYIWTQAEVAFVMQRPANARKLRFKIALPPITRNIRLFLDQQQVWEIQSKPRKHAPEFHTFEVSLPVAMHQQPTLRFQVDRNWTPQQLWGGDDTRQLGVAIAALAYQ